MKQQACRNCATPTSSPYCPNCKPPHSRPQGSNGVTLRQQIRTRDNNKCAIRNCTNTTNLEVHHIKPLAHGGSNDPDNLVTLCAYHHKQQT